MFERIFRARRAVFAVSLAAKRRVADPKLPLIHAARRKFVKYFSKSCI